MGWRELYNKLVQEWLDNNNTLMYSTHNEGKSVIAERYLNADYPALKNDQS